MNDVGDNDQGYDKMLHSPGKLCWRYSIIEDVFCWYSYHHSQYFGFSGHNQAYNQSEVSSDLLFFFGSSGNVSVDNSAFSLKGVSSFHCYQGGREAVFNEASKQDNLAFEIRDDYGDKQTIQATASTVINLEVMRSNDT